MRRRALLVSIVAASLVAAPTASAKEVQQVRLCGATDCVTFDRGNSGGKLQLFAETGTAASAPRRAVGWYRLRTRIGGEGMEPVVFTNAYVPSLGVIRVDDEGGGGYAWYSVNPEIAPVLRNAAGRLAPRPAATLHVNDIAPGVPAPTATASPPPRRDSGAGGGGWWMIAAAGGAALIGGLLVVRRR
jgi:hypothetical protein